MAVRVMPVLLIFVLACARVGEGESARPDDVPVKVSMVALDTHATPVLVLEEEDGSRWLPIWIGTAEARSIAAQIEERSAPRPNTHDLAKRVIQGLEGEVVHVVVTELRDSTYYATLAIRVRGSVIEIDSRPSDAIAIALRMDAPILVRATLFDEAAQGSESESPRRSIDWTPPVDAQRDGTPSATPPGTI